MLAILPSTYGKSDARVALMLRVALLVWDDFSACIAAGGRQVGGGGAKPATTWASGVLPEENANPAPELGRPLEQAR